MTKYGNSMDIHESAMVAHEVKHELMKTSSDICIHSTYKSEDENFLTMVAHEVKQASTDSSSALGPNVTDYNDSKFTMTSHEVKQVVDELPSSKPLDVSTSNSNSTIVAHEVKQATDESLWAIFSNSVAGDDNEGKSTMVAHEVQITGTESSP